MEKKLLSGNEAIARGAWEAGVVLAAAYPGTPSTEILENIAKYKDIYSEWSTNEKVAFEVALGAAFSGKRSICAMKHVGLNVAADPYFTASYTGIEGGFVIVSADDPGMHSSQNEQDNRNYAKFAKIPMLEPSDSQEAKDFVKAALEISEKYDTPVLLRITTRIAHSKSIVELLPRTEAPQKPFPEKNPKKYVTIPAHARVKRAKIEERSAALAELSEEIPLNKEESGGTELGFITSGISYQYIKESFPEAAVLKLAMTHPLPFKKAGAFVKKMKRTVVVEELDAYIETELKARGITVEGKNVIPVLGELNTDIVRNAIKDIRPEKPAANIPVRPPALCPGCPHRGVFVVLRELGLRVVGDIGCYTLGVLPPLSSIDWQVCMGAGISMVQGIEKAWKDAPAEKIVGMVGDSTFFHSGITGLIDVVYNKGKGTLFVVDNSTTAMTGVQDHPGTGRTLMGEPAEKIDIKEICRACGVKEVYEVNPHDLDELYDIVEKAVASPVPSVIITKLPCVLLRFKAKERFVPIVIDQEKCIGCKTCLSVGCPALSFDTEKKKMIAIPFMCVGCEVCSALCPVEAHMHNGERIRPKRKHKIRGKK